MHKGFIIFTEEELKEEIRKAFHIKMNFKNLEFEGIHQMMNEGNDKQVKAGWQNSLAHQIPGGIEQSYEEVRQELLELLTEIFNN